MTKEEKLVVIDSLAEQLRPLIVHAKGALEELESARLQAIREQ